LTSPQPHRSSSVCQTGNTGSPWAAYSSAASVLRVIAPSGGIMWTPFSSARDMRGHGRERPDAVGPASRVGARPFLLDRYGKPFWKSLISWGLWRGLQDDPLLPHGPRLFGPQNGSRRASTRSSGLPSGRERTWLPAATRAACRSSRVY